MLRYRSCWLSRVSAGRVGGAAEQGSGRARPPAPPQLGIFGDDAGPVPWVSGFSACFALAAERSKPYVHAMMIDTEQTAERRRARLLSTHRAIGEGRGRPIGHAVADGRDDGQCRE